MVLMKKKKMVGNILVGIIIALAGLSIINRYLFSWSWLLSESVGLCEYKTIGVPGWNAHDVTLSFTPDLKQIASALSSNPNYEVSYYNDYSVVIRRIYGETEY